MSITTPDELTRLFLLAINQHIQSNTPTEETSLILAETYIRLVQELADCKDGKKLPLPNSNYIAALGTVVYYTKQS